MANHKSAEKRARQSVKRRARNNSVKAAVKSKEKSLVKALTAKTKDVETQLRDFVAQISKAVSKGAVNKKTASRRISRLSKRSSAATATK